MWAAPTAEDWKRPCLITWQRTWEDAVAVSRETGKPILVCVNMDGEIASEHYAGIRYRRPETATLYEPYVCVIASVYRHNPRDYDEQGRRILCPRFGSVTCGEHIAIEPGLYDKFFEGERVAPRHIGLELDGKEMYDVYYAWDTDTIFNALRDGMQDRPERPPLVRGDIAIADRVASRDIGNRIAVEEAYIDGNKAERRALLEAAIEHPEAAPVDLLRLAIFGFDAELTHLARKALAESESDAAINLINEALRVHMEDPERDALIAALGRIGKNSPRGRMLAAVHQGIASSSGQLDARAWIEALDQGAGANATPAQEESAAAGEAIKNQQEILARGDAAARLELAEAYLTLAESQPETEEQYARFAYKDAQAVARDAAADGAEPWRAQAVAALAAYALGETDGAYAAAEAAVSAIPPGTRDRNAAAVLDIFAEGRWKQIAAAVRGKVEWGAWSEAFEGTGQWLTDLHAAYSVLERHPYGTDTQVVAHYDFLRILSATGEAGRVLDEGLARFPESWALHDRLRGRILAEKGAQGLEAAYDEMLQKPGAPAGLEWYAGYASLVAAEFHRRAGRNDEARSAYDRAIAHYERLIAAIGENRDGADHYIAMALAGRARLAFEREDYETSLGELLACFERSPEAAASPDGLNISPVDTARMLRQRLLDAQRGDLVAKLETALGKLDPEALRLPAYERAGPSGGQPPRSGRPPRQRRGS